jgi:hypothetical protein
MVTLIKFLFALYKHHLPLGAICKSNLFPKGQLSEDSYLLFVCSLVYRFNQVRVDEVGIRALISTSLPLFKPAPPLLLDNLAYPLELCSPLQPSLPLLLLFSPVFKKVNIFPEATL